MERLSRRIWTFFQGVSFHIALINALLFVRQSVLILSESWVPPVPLGFRDWKHGAQRRGTDDGLEWRAGVSAVLGEPDLDACRTFGVEASGAAVVETDRRW